MNKGLKYTLIGLALVGASIGIYFLVKKKKEPKGEGEVTAETKGVKIIFTRKK